MNGGEEEGGHNASPLPSVASYPLAVIGPNATVLWTNHRERSALHPVCAVTARAEHPQPSGVCSVAADMLRAASTR